MSLAKPVPGVGQRRVTLFMGVSPEEVKTC